VPGLRLARGAVFGSLACAAVHPPGPGRMKSGLDWRISSTKGRRFLLRDGCLTATDGTAPPWPPFASGGKVLGVAFGCARRFDRIAGGCGPSASRTPTRNGRILISCGNSIAVCADHSCRQGVRCLMPDFYHPSVCELQPLNVRSRTTRFFGLPGAPAGLCHRDGACPTAGEASP
jgi:hypothetical protein